MPTTSSISPAHTLTTGPHPPRDNAWTDLSRDHPCPTPTSLNIWSCFRTTVDSFIDRHQTPPSTYTPSRRGRTYRRAKGRIKRLGTWCKELITSSKIQRTTSIGRSQGLAPDGRPNTNLFGSQLATPVTSSPELTRSFSFQKNKALASAPVLDVKGGALHYGPNSISGHGKKKRLVRYPTTLSGTTAASNPKTPQRYYAQPDMPPLFANALSATRSVNSVDHQHHCKDADGGMIAKKVDLKNRADTEDPVDTVASQNDKESVDCRESEDYKESVISEKRVEYESSLYDKNTNVMEGIPCIPPFNFDLDIVEFDFGFEKPESWCSQLESIVV